MVFVTLTLPGSQRTSADARLTTRKTWWALAVVLVGVFMASLDGFIVLVAAPAIQTKLHASNADVQLIIAGYQLTYAVGLITGARLGDRFGRKKMFMYGMALFTLASLGCGLSPDAAGLIVGRLVQGLGAAAMFPQVFAFIQVLLPPERRHSAFGALGAVIGVSTISGQIVGGSLISANLFGTSWRPIFFVNVPIGIAALVLAARLVPESRAPAGRRLDLAGATILTLALFLLVVPLVGGRQAGWPVWVWLSFFCSFVAFIAFIAFERRAEARGQAPLVAMRLFSDRAFSVGIALTTVAFAGVYSIFLVLSVTLQDGLGMSPLGAALVYTPLAVAFFATSLIAGRLAPRYGRRILEIGSVLSGIGFIATIVVAAGAGGHLTYGELIPSLICIGAGNGLFLTQIFNAVLARIGPNDVGTASGVLSTSQQIGGALGVAVIGLVFYNTLGPAVHGGIGSYSSALVAAVICNLVIAVAVTGLVIALPKQRSAPAT